MSLLGVITARGGSKRLPQKNKLDLGGKPLVAWTIEAALAAKCIDKLIVSTDDIDIAEIAVNLGAEVPYLRSKELSTDLASSAETLADVISKFPGYEHTILLQPTSPLRTTTQIEEAYRSFVSSNAENLVSVTKLHQKISWLLELESDSHIYPLFDNSDIDKPVFAYNGAIYIVHTTNFMKTKSFLSSKTLGFVMDSITSMDIDTKEDMDFCRALISLNGTSE
ncbi:acylneuraminate cytidylyltransferase family protein [Aurantimicrobium minutum]|uniref:acylneuraminate cytidylyltransferase family protein n=1 Tax=Aurantimicrobium minutum TaxID=708131 RepID=UPI002476008E|nr:acylneuraminate cytidylyltransferase family protein [Aurantimicrobium minutum]MDH6256026.1 CMP-N,N'-diacetyllegionaminic acid synthase [Aurantimicrobium minutum]